MKLLTTLKSLLNSQKIKQLEIADESTIQHALATDLRRLSLNHLANGQGHIAKSFRGEYIHAAMGPYQDFIKAQSKPGTWGTYLEATALGELLGCHVIVTPVKNGNQQKPICLYRASDETASTIHLYNSNNTHWYVNSKTKGDGNCLFNAFAQALQQTVKPVLQREAAEKDTGPMANQSNHFFNQPETTEQMHQALLLQRSIEAAVVKAHPKPAECEAMNLKEMQRISELPVAEQHQIQNDYALALKLATEDLAYVKNNVTSVKSISSNVDESSFIKPQF